MITKVVCQLCGTQLDVIKSDRKGLTTPKSGPCVGHAHHVGVCPVCAERIREASRWAGYEEGYDQGYDDGDNRTASQEEAVAASFDLGHDAGFECGYYDGEIRGFDHDFVSQMTAGLWCNSWGDPDDGHDDSTDGTVPVTGKSAQELLAQGGHRNLLAGRPITLKTKGDANG